MLLPSSSVASIYTAVAPFCPAAAPDNEFNLTIPVPGSEDAAELASNVKSNEAPPKLPSGPFAPILPLVPVVPLGPNEPFGPKLPLGPSIPLVP
jgi:hypothetical protein